MPPTTLARVSKLYALEPVTPRASYTPTVFYRQCCCCFGRPTPPARPPMPPPHAECTDGVETCTPYSNKIEADDYCADPTNIGTGATCVVRRFSTYKVLRERLYPTCEAAGYETISDLKECKDLMEQGIVPESKDRWYGSGGLNAPPKGCSVYKIPSNPTQHDGLIYNSLTGSTTYSCNTGQLTPTTRDYDCVCRDQSVFPTGKQPYEACLCRENAPPTPPALPVATINDEFETTTANTCTTKTPKGFNLTPDLCKTYANSRGHQWSGEIWPDGFNGGEPGTSVVPSGCFYTNVDGSIVVSFNPRWSSTTECGTNGITCVCSSNDIAHALPNESPHICNNAAEFWPQRVNCIGANINTNEDSCVELGCCWDGSTWEDAMQAACYQRFGDVNWKILLEIDASTDTKILHRKKPNDDGGLLSVGDHVRYLPLDSLRPGAGAPLNTFDVCTNVHNYPADGGQNNDYGGILQEDGNGELYVHVNIPDINMMQHSHAELVYCYRIMSARRRLQTWQVVDPAPWLRGGGTLSVRFVEAPSAPPPPPPPPQSCDETSEVTKPAATEVSSSDVACVDSLLHCPQVSEVVDDRLRITILPYSRCLPDCSKAALDATPSCLGKCHSGWVCCASLGNTCVREGDACPACPDCAIDDDPCPNSLFDFPTPMGTRQCCSNVANTPPT